jgi:hypothetical protein
VSLLNSENRDNKQMMRRPFQLTELSCAVFNLVKNRFVLMKSPATGELGKLNRLLQEKVSLSRDSMGKSRKKAKKNHFCHRIRPVWQASWSEADVT